MKAKDRNWLINSQLKPEKTEEEQKIFKEMAK